MQNFRADLPLERLFGRIISRHFALFYWLLNSCKGYEQLSPSFWSGKIASEFNTRKFVSRVLACRRDTRKTHRERRARQDGNKRTENRIARNETTDRVSWPDTEAYWNSLEGNKYSRQMVLSDCYEPGGGYLFFLWFYYSCSTVCYTLFYYEIIFSLRSYI